MWRNCIGCIVRGYLKDPGGGPRKNPRKKTRYFTVLVAIEICKIPVIVFPGTYPGSLLFRGLYPGSLLYPGSYFFGDFTSIWGNISFLEISSRVTSHFTPVGCRDFIRFIALTPQINSTCIDSFSLFGLSIPFRIPHPNLSQGSFLESCLFE